MPRHIASEPALRESSQQRAGAALAGPDATRRAPQTDEALIRSIGRGDAWALGELYDRFAGASYGLALRVVRDPGLAEDAVQDAFMSVWRSARSFDVRRGIPRNWLLTLVYRRAVDVVEASARGKRLEQLDGGRPEPGGISSSDAAALRADRRGVQKALDSLPEKQRQPLQLAYYGGYSQSEIASELGLPLGTIKSQMFNGLKRLRELLVEEEGAAHVEQSPVSGPP